MSDRSRDTCISITVPLFGVSSAKRCVSRDLRRVARKSWNEDDFKNVAFDPGLRIQLRISGERVETESLSLK